MKSLKFIAFSALMAATAAVATPATAGSKPDPRPVTKAFQVSGFTWGKHGDAVFMWAPFNHDGKLEICGLYSTSGGKLGTRFTKKALSQGKIKLEGETMVSNLGFFKYARESGRATKHIGDLANCKISKQAYPTDPSKLEIKFRSGGYSVRK